MVDANVPKFVSGRDVKCFAIFTAKAAIGNHVQLACVSDDRGINHLERIMRDNRKSVTKT